MSASQPKVTIQDPNPKRGQRGDFLKITITMPAEMLSNLQTLGLRRRVAGQKDTDISSLIREAVADLLRIES